MLKASALLINLVIIVCEVYTFLHLKKKRDILKYYTYLQNFFAFITSLIFCTFLIANIVSGAPVPEFSRGLRYVATSGLVTTTFIFVVFLGAGKKITMTEDDFLSGLRPETANLILHYLCPALSFISFVVLEREVALSNGIWTSAAAIPSCAYWVMYLILSATKMWEEPYQFSAKGRRKTILDTLTFLLIPLSFIFVSFVLWNLK